MFGLFNKKDEEPAVYEIVDPNLGENAPLAGHEYVGKSGKVIADGIVDYVNEQRAVHNENPPLSVRKRR
jgi:hypothetical protein